MEVKKPKIPARSALGRGLSSLISTPVSAFPMRDESNSARPPQVVANLAVESRQFETTQQPTHSGDEIRFISVEIIAGNPSQPRQDFKEAELKELADSIKSKGVLQPVLLRPALSSQEEKPRFEIIAGERRWRAAKLAGLERIPAIVRDLDDREALELSIIENVQRENLSPIEEAHAYQRLAADFSLSQQDIAEKVGKDRASIANYLRLLKLPSEVIDLLRGNQISMGHAKAILSIREPSAQLSLARKVVKESLSVRDLEAIVSRVVVLDAGHRLSGKAAEAAKEAAAKSISNIPANFNVFPEVIDRMRNALGTKVVIKHHRSGRGRIEIEYFSEAELDRIVEHICR